MKSQNNMEINIDMKERKKRSIAFSHIHLDIEVNILPGHLDIWETGKKKSTNNGTILVCTDCTMV